MIEDVELLKRYANDGCAKSFELIVRRHIGWVYSAALRLVRDAALAEDLTQSVFVLLESRAASMKEGVALSGWLFNTLRFIAREFRRKDQRRRKHEARAALPEGARAPNGVDDAVWEQMSPLLEEAVATLSEQDRQAVLQRFYEGAEFAQIGKSLGITEVAARKRVSRAVKRLGAFFKQKGVIVPAVVLASVLFAHTASAAPSGLIQSVISAAGGKAGAALACELARNTAMRFMVGRRKLAAAIVACMGLLGIAVWIVLMAWVISAPDEGTGASIPLTQTNVQYPAPAHELSASDFDLPHPRARAYANFDFAQPPATRPHEEVAEIDALWWFREWYDIRNSLTTPRGKQDGTESEDDPVIEDPRTHERHRRSWYEEHDLPIPDSFDNLPQRGGGGGSGAGRAAVADGHGGNASDGGARSGGGTERGGSALVDVAIALVSSNPGGNSGSDTPALANNSRDGAGTLMVANTSTVSIGDFRSRLGFHMGGETIVFSNGGTWGVYDSGYLIVQSGSGNSAHLSIILPTRLHRETEYHVSGSLGTSDVAYSFSLNDAITVNGDGTFTISSNSLPPDFDLSDPKVMAELEKIVAKYGHYSLDQVSIGYVGDHGQIVWAAVPEPGIGVLALAIGFGLRRRRRSATAG